MSMDLPKGGWCIEDHLGFVEEDTWLGYVVSAPKLTDTMEEGAARLEET